MTGRPDTSTRWSGVPGFILSRRFVVLFAVVFGLYIFGWSTKWTFNPSTIGSYWAGHFYSAQADAMLHGRLWIDSSNLPGECFYSGGKCYGYFGIVPSLLRIPFVLFLGVQRAEMTPLFLSVGAGIAMWAALELCRRVLCRECPEGGGLAATWMVLAAVVLGPGGVLILLTDPYVYQEAIVWSIAGMLVGTLLFWRWWIENRTWQFVTATVALVLAAGSRPTASLVGVVLAAGLLVRSLVARQVDTAVIWRALAIGVLPIVFVIGIFFAKFGKPLPPDSGYQGRSYRFVQYVASNNDGELSNGWRYIPTGLLATLRPDTLRIGADSALISFRFGRPYGDDPLERITYVAPLRDDAMNVEPTVSLTDAMPLPLVATVAAAIAIVLRRRRRYELLILVALITPPLLMLTSWTVATRYLGDYLPLLVAGTAFSACLIPSFRRLGIVTRSVLGVFVFLLAIASVPVVSALATQYDWIYRFGID